MYYYNEINIQSQGSQLTIGEYSYRDSLHYDLMVESFNEIDFMGVMGKTKFNIHGETYGMISIEQYIGLYLYV